MGVSVNKLPLMTDWFKNILQCKQQFVEQSIDYQVKNIQQLAKLTK